MSLPLFLWQKKSKKEKFIVNYMLAENPYMGMYNPRKKRRKKRNAGLPSVGKMTGWARGVTPQEFLAGFANLVFTSWAPAMMIKNVSSTTDKLLRVGAAILTATVGAAVVAAITKGGSPAKAAAIGGYASAGVQALSVFNIAQLGRGGVGKSLPAGVARGRVAAPGGRGVGANPAVPMPARLV